MKYLIFLVISLHVFCLNAQNFYDDFNLPLNNVGTSGGDWINIYAGDPWSTSLNDGGLSPLTDAYLPSEALGGASDTFDNMLILKNTNWYDVQLDLSFYVKDNDTIGAVLRFRDLDNFMVVMLSRDEIPAILGGVDTVSPGEIRIYSMKDGVLTEITNYKGSYVSVSNRRQYLRIKIEERRIRVWLATNSLPVGSNDVPVIDVDSVIELPKSGAPGVYSFAMGEGVSGTFYEDFRVSPIDSDLDGRTNDDEILYGTDPFDSDSDDDGISDGDEYKWNVDSDNDGFVNANDPDSDNDGIFDGVESGLTVPDDDTDLSAGFFTPDKGPSTTTDRLNSDSDNGGKSDGDEDLNHNGLYEPLLGETDPNDPDDDFKDSEDEIIDTENNISTDVLWDSETDTSVSIETDDGQTDLTDSETEKVWGEEIKLSGGWSCTTGLCKMSRGSIINLIF
ncbi:MAG: hypothetical protein JXR91_13800 [Deltaproteobacteria bacterium]|nr:hypothetical protein [Deltaproteobacteria bacterium]